MTDEFRSQAAAGFLPGRCLNAGLIVAIVRVRSSVRPGRNSLDGIVYEPLIRRLPSYGCDPRLAVRQLLRRVNRAL